MAQDINWEKLDKQKFLVWGAGLFSVSFVLYTIPQTVVKQARDLVTHPDA